MTLAESGIARHGKRRNGHARLSTIDMDPTDAATYGAQQLSFFNTHYDNHCYPPMPGFVRGETRYAAKSWKRERRVIIKAEAVKADGKEARDNPRFVVASMKQSARWLYEEVYCQRGDVENRIKALKALDVDRISYTNFWANPLRVLMAAVAYVLLQDIRLNAALTTLARAQVWTLRERLLKLGARLVTSVRRIVVHLPEPFPWRNDFQKIAAALGATAG